MKTSWKTKDYYAEDMFIASPKYILKTSLRHLEYQQNFALSIKRPSFNSFINIRKSNKEHGNSGNIFKVNMKEDRTSSKT